MDWFKKRGLTKQVTKTLEEDSKISDKKKGDVVTYDEVTTYYSGGRIDVYGTDDPFGTELGLDVMHGEDYNKFSNWLANVKTETVWSFALLVEEYEKTNPKIRWATELE